MAKASQKTDATKPSEETAVAAATAKVEAVVPPAEAAGLRRSAIALLLLGDEISEGLFRAFRPIHVRRILDASKTLRGVTEEEVLSVLEGLVGELENGVIGVSGHAHRIEEAAVSVFGADLIRASRDVKGAAMQMHAVAVEKPEAFARTLAGEHPQAIAIVLAMLAPEVGANVLQMMPAQLKVDVVRRIARLKSVNASVLAGVTESVGREFGQVGDEGPVTLNGTDMAVKLLKSVGSLDEQLILNALDELDTDLTETIRSKLF
ncbi:MAG: flagellar motor switch protein FliG, partial [Myxococcota bacterium]